MGPTEQTEPAEAAQPVVAGDPEQAAFDAARAMYPEANATNTQESVDDSEINEDTIYPVSFQFGEDKLRAFITGAPTIDQFGNKIYPIIPRDKSGRDMADFPKVVPDWVINGTEPYSAENPKPIEKELSPEAREEAVEDLEEFAVQAVAEEAAAEKPSEWSEAAHEAKKEDNRPTRDNPFMHEFGDRMVHTSFSRDGQQLRGSVQGWFYEGGRKISLINLDAASQKLTGLHGLVEKDGDILTQSDIPDITTDDDTSTSETNPRTEEEPKSQEERLADILARAPDLTDQDKKNLEDYALTESAIIRNKSINDREGVKGWTRARDEAYAKVVASPSAYGISGAYREEFLR